MWTTYPTLPYRTVPYLHGGQHVVHGGGVGLDDLPAPAQVELQVARHSLDGGRGGMYVWVGECNVCVSECACRSLVPRPGRTAALGSCAGPPTARPARCPPAEQPARPGGSPAHRHTGRGRQAVTWQWGLPTASSTYNHTYTRTFSSPRCSAMFTAREYSCLATAACTHTHTQHTHNAVSLTVAGTEQASRIARTSTACGVRVTSKSVGANSKLSSRPNTCNPYAASNA